MIVKSINDIHETCCKVSNHVCPGKKHVHCPTFGLVLNPHTQNSGLTNMCATLIAACSAEPLLCFVFHEHALMFKNSCDSSADSEKRICLMRTTLPAVSAQLPVRGYARFSPWFQKGKLRPWMPFQRRAGPKSSGCTHSHLLTTTTGFCLWLLSNRRSNALLKDTLLLEEEQTFIANLLWIFYFTGKAKDKKEKSITSMSWKCLCSNLAYRCLFDNPLKHLLYCSPWSTHGLQQCDFLIWHLMQRSNLLGSVASSPPLKVYQHIWTVSTYGQLCVHMSIDWGQILDL